jgi:octaprenyl-diphosphate synthase
VIANARLFGLHLGLAFQIKDDLLDYLGDCNIMGKNVGDDLLEGKLTLPMIYLQSRNEQYFHLVINKLKKNIFNNQDFINLQQELINTNSICDSHNKISMHQALALSFLDKMPVNKLNIEYKQQLIKIVSRLAKRQN